MRVQAAVMPAVGAAFEFRELELDEPREDEVQVRLVAAGVCHTDAVVRDGLIPTTMPIVLGHEGSGVVERVGAAVRHLRPGDHVVISAASCGICRSCLSGHPSYCVDPLAQNFAGGRADGSRSLTDPESGEQVNSHFLGQSSFATVVNVAARTVVKVPDDVPLELLGPLGCGVQTGAGAVLNILKPGVGDSIVVYGTGAVGMSAVLAAVASRTSTIVAVDINPARLDLALALGATHAVDGAASDAAERILAATGGGADTALDTTGVPAVFRQMVEILAPSGHAGTVAASAPGGEGVIDLATTLGRGVRVSFILYGDAVPQLFIPALIALWRRGDFPFDELIRKYPFADIDTAFADAEEGRTLKPVVLF